ncbi:MAG: gliding motility protein GldL [Bacteroidia bacterium]|nr:gliding motility protein GldL [Bacteroidia bacterium]MDW8014788.1 gliding motility protein GldL [Bacteroidia bacterium]
MAAKRQGAFDALLRSRGYRIAMKYLYAWGASVVIIGALFKILHLPGANEMLIVGLGTEAAVFFVSGLEPLPEDEKHWDWSRVFPQLKEEGEEEPVEMPLGLGGPGGGLMPGLGAGIKSLQESSLTPDLLEQLASSIEGLRLSVTNLADITDAAVATNEFAEKVREASVRVEQLSQSYAVTADAMSKIAASFGDIQSYQAQIRTLSHTIAQLNSVYESELQEIQKHIAAIGRFYGGIGRVLSSIEATAADADQLRQELVGLNTNLRGLNAVYGGMLSGISAAFQR